MNKKQVLISFFALSLISTKIFALKMTVKNDSSKIVTVFFISQSGKQYGSVDIIPNDTKSRDLVLGTSLLYFTINGKEVRVNDDGAIWTLTVKDATAPYTFEYVLDRKKSLTSKIEKSYKKGQI